jgi:hypothetical protein
MCLYISEETVIELNLLYTYCHTNAASCLTLCFCHFLPLSAFGWDHCANHWVTTAGYPKVETPDDHGGLTTTTLAPNGDKTTVSSGKPHATCIRMSLLVLVTVSSGKPTDSACVYEWHAYTSACVYECMRVRAHACTSACVHAMLAAKPLEQQA